MEFIILDIFGLIIFFKWVRLGISHSGDTTIKKSFYSKIRYFALSLVLITLPILVVNTTDIEEVFSIKGMVTKDNHYIFATILSFLVSILWLRYMLKLDIFNKEKKKHILLVFVVAIILTLLAEIPYSMVHAMGIIQSDIPVNGFIYSVFGIGLVEESIKIIPFLLILLMTDAIDEPFDYILFATVSALGFSFVENAMYLDEYGLYIVNARALFATVVHMTFSSLIAYGIYLAKYKRTKYPGMLIIVFFFFLSILSHGFYDFWIMNPNVQSYTWLTTLYFLISIHIWFSIKNNALNMSEFYDENIKLNNDTLKIYLIFGLLSILMFSYLYVAFINTEDIANEFFIKTILIYGYIIFYIIATLTNYNLIQGFVKPIRLRIKNILPYK